MKKIALLILFSQFSYANYLSVITNEHNKFKPVASYTDNIIYSSWSKTGIYDCSVDFQSEDYYFGIDFTQTTMCDEKETRTATTERTYENGTKEVIKTETETRYEPAPDKTTVSTVQGSHLEDSCDKALNFDNTLVSGGYKLKLDDSILVDAYCNMTLNDGGWTLVMSQTSSGGLSASFDDVNVNNFTNVNSNFRWGNDKLKTIRPSVSWMFTDDTATTYFNKNCIVDLNNDLNGTTNDCSIAYSDRSFTTHSSERTVINASRGIGQNNSGQFNSSRIYLDVDAKSYSRGDAFPSNPDVSHSIKLWFR